MPTQLLLVGPPTLLVQNQIYALPAVKVTLFTDATTPTLQSSNTAAFTANTALTLTAGATTVTGGWIRATTAGATVTFKRD